MKVAHLHAAPRAEKPSHSKLRVALEAGAVWLVTSSALLFGWYLIHR